MKQALIELAGVGGGGVRQMYREQENSHLG